MSRRDWLKNEWAFQFLVDGGVSYKFKRKEAQVVRDKAMRHVVRHSFVAVLVHSHDTD